jgi:hypothetical protein
MKSKVFFIFSLLFLSSGLLTTDVQSRAMCCPPRDKCAPKADKCSPQAQCVAKDKCSGCPDGLIETNKWWKI